MFAQLENPAVVQTQPFPHRVTALHSRIKGADPGFVAMHQLSVDVHKQITVSFVEFLKHFSFVIPSVTRNLSSGEGSTQAIARPRDMLDDAQQRDASKS